MFPVLGDDAGKGANRRLNSELRNLFRIEPLYKEHL